MPRNSGLSQGISRLAVASALLSALLPATAVMAGPEGCLSLPAPSGTTVNVSTVAELQATIANLQSNTTVLIADGTYQLTNTLNLRSVSNVAVRGASGNAGAVILSGKGMSNIAYGNVPHVMAVFDATDVTVADLTLRDAYFHGIQIHGENDADRVRLVRTRVFDNGEQQVKVSTAGTPGPYADDGVVECSVIGYTDRARSAYTNGVDVLAGSGWIIRDNTFQNIRAPSGQLAGPAVLMWRNSTGTIVERNRFIENDRAIAFGLSAPDANSRDDQGSIFEADINAIAVAGITTGCDAGRFCPDQGVTRAQMASFLRGALALTPIPTGPFVDVGGIHESDINAIAAAGITQGCGASIYCPDGLVTRGQMAAFLHRSFG